MSEVYVALTTDGAFAAFWDQPTDQTVRFFTPSGTSERFFSAPWSQWEGIRLTDANPAEFPDIVNFASITLALSSDVIVKSDVRVSLHVPGQYHPRLWRGLYKTPAALENYDPIDNRTTYGSTYLQSMISAESLFFSLSELFRYIEPSDHNTDVFSHRLRQLLILACTEVEASWRGFIENNGYTVKPSYSTNDYVKLKEIFRLEEWQVGLKDYPDITTLIPFRGWDEAQPTQSLRWYSGYNGVKHNRESEFAAASLRNVLDAMAALFVMQNAQWGPTTFDKIGYDRQSPFYLKAFPAFRPEDLYVPSLSGTADFRPANYFK